MKTLFQSKHTAFIIISDLVAVMQRNADGEQKPIYTNEPLGLAEHKEQVSTIQFYIHEKDMNGYDTEKATCIYLNPEDILQLADKVTSMTTKKIISKYECIPW